MLNPHRDEPISKCGASAGLLDFVRMHRVGIIDFNGIEDEEHPITQLEVNSYWGHLVGTEMGKKKSEATAMYHDLVNNRNYSQIAAMAKIERDLSPLHAALYQGSKTTGELSTLASAFEHADYDFASLDVDMQDLYIKHREKDGAEELNA